MESSTLIAENVLTPQTRIEKKMKMIINHSLTHPSTHSLTHSLTHPPTHSPLTHPPTHSPLTHSLTHSLTMTTSVLSLEKFNRPFLNLLGLPSLNSVTSRMNTPEHNGMRDQQINRQTIQAQTDRQTNSLTTSHKYSRTCKLVTNGPAHNCWLFTPKLSNNFRITCVGR